MTRAARRAERSGTAESCRACSGAAVGRVSLWRLTCGTTWFLGWPATASLSLKSQAAGRKRVGTCRPGRKPRFEKRAERLRPTEDPSHTCRHMVHTKTHSGSKIRTGLSATPWRVCFRSTPVLYRGLRGEALGVSGVAERVDPRRDRSAQAAALLLDARQHPLGHIERL